MSKKVWFCANCGYEVTSRGRCFRCRDRLTLSPLPELEVGDEDDEVGYRLNEWDDRGRGRMIVALIRANVEHRFEEEELIVSADDEAKVDDLLAELQAVLATEDAEGKGPAGAGANDEEEGAEDAAALEGTGSTVDDERDEATTQAVEELYFAAARLHKDPTDMQADADVAEASAGVFGSEDFYGLDPETWSAVGRVTRRLLGALGADEALEDEIRTQAGVLVKLLGPTIDPRAEPVVTATAGERTRDLLAESTAALPEGRRDHGGLVADEEDGGGDGLGASGDDISGSDGLSGDGETEEDDGPGTKVPEPDEIVYELPDWLPDQRANLSLVLDSAEIAHSWDGGDLVVAAAREAEVDAIFDRIESAAESDDDDEGARYHALEELFAAADRLANDPDDPARRTAVALAVDAADGPTPVGMADVQWWQLRARTRGLVDAINMGAGSTRISDEAGAVRDLLRAIV